MKLTDVKTYVIRTDPPNWGGPLWFFTKLETDEGIEGWGETAVLSCLHGLEKSYEATVKAIFDRLLKGQDPVNREPLYHMLYTTLTAQHPDYVALGLLSSRRLHLSQGTPLHTGSASEEESPCDAASGGIRLFAQAAAQAWHTGAQPHRH